MAAIHATPKHLRMMAEMLEKEKECYERHEPHKALPFIEQFHMSIIEASGNPYLIECLRKIISLTHIILTFYDVSDTHSCDVYEEHEALYKAICNRDYNRATQLSHLHIPSIIRDIDFTKKFNRSL
ncbi:FCD domain-containing protein [Thermaerobacillus caldiproteolyticus]|uniref:FCD domain-containing protein n=1 Tax=Thermaerobacillus caldiproteolyticus TaxID=247480 RepID=UPI0022642B19|nr:FCD domain-containing protein [Anoxybacillus caldiproteolyticus]